MRVPIKSALAALVLVVAGPLAVAQAVEPASTATSSPATVRAVSVEGVSVVGIDQQATGTTADAVYRQALAQAVLDGQAKATFLAEKTGATLGAVQSITEEGGDIECGEAEYEGTMPDFGNGESSVAVTPEVAARSGTAKGATGKAKTTTKHKRHKRPRAKTAAVSASCTLSTQVALTFALE